MGCTIGIDIGAVSVKAALLIEADRPVRAGALSRAGTARDGRAVYLSEYRRTKGKPLAAVRELLEQIIASVGQDAVEGLCLTGSGANLVAGTLGARQVNEFKAIAAGFSALGIPARTVFEMGGEASKYIRLAGEAQTGYSIVDYATNGDCAAGTGSFIDQQAGRLLFESEQVGQIALAAPRAAQVAGRCSVFAKSDMIHAQQKGYTPGEVLRGLCTAVARNFRTAVVRSHPVVAPVAFVGGLAANAAVRAALREVFGLDESQLFIPEHFTHMPAIGAALAAGAEAAGLVGLEALRAASDTAAGAFATSPPLSMDNVVLLRDRSEPHRLPEDGSRVEAYLGVDIGSVSTNVVLIDERGRVIHEIYTMTQGRPIEVVTEALRSIHRELGDRVRVRGVGTTGSGRELIGQLIGADTVNDEITAHKTGATFVARTMLDGRLPDTIFEIGGQDSKYISLQDGIVVDFTMNEACAAGTGSFLQERADELDIPIKGEFARLALSSAAPISLGERCTVFMERDVNTCLQRGASKADLVAGLAYSVAYNYINRVVRGRPIGETVFFQGGTAYNDAVAAAFSAVTGKPIIVPPYNGVIGAIGAALLAMEMMQGTEDDAGVQDERIPASQRRGIRDGDTKTEGTYVSEETGRTASRFRGYDVSRVDYGLREFTCKACANACQIQEFTVEGEKTYWGDKCSDRYRKRARSAAKPVIEDLFALRTRLLEDTSACPVPPAGAPVVGIPRTMFAIEQLPFWRTLLAHCGLRTVVSEPTNKALCQAGLDSVVAEPCFPIIVAHGHVLALAKRDDVDYVLVPNIVTSDSPAPGQERFLCPWHTTLPLVVRQAPALGEQAGKLLTPVVYLSDGPEALVRALLPALKPLGVSRRRLRGAVEAAGRAQEAFHEAFFAAGRRAMATLEDSRAPGVVLIGRPYNLHDAGVNLSVAGKLRDYYGVNVVPLDALDTSDVDIDDVNDNMFWEMGRRCIAAARIVGRHDNLHVIYITNFKCGPDSFVKHYIRKASGKPFLTLQFDGHSNDAGMMTRCEAYLDSKGIIRRRGRTAPAKAIADCQLPIAD